MLARVNDGQVNDGPAAPQSHKPSIQERKSFRDVSSPPHPPRPLIAVHSAGRIPAHAGRDGASLAKPLPSRWPLNLALCGSSLSGWILPGPLPAAHKALSASPLPSAGVWRDGHSFGHHGLFYVYKIFHSLHKTFISDTQTEISLYGGVSVITSQVQRHPHPQPGQ